MSKALAIGATGVGGGGAAVGGYLLLSNKGGSATTTDSQEKTTTQEEAKKEFWTLQEFKDGKGGDCVKELFTNQDPEINFGTLPSSASLPTGDDYFGTVPTGDQQTPQSCLIINWKKETKAESKWSGVFTWTWTFVNGNKAFINFNAAKAEEQEKLKVTGGFYLLEKKTENGGGWEIKHYKEVTDGKEIGKSDFATKFPKQKSAKPKGDQTQDWWGFVTGDGDLTNISNADSSTSTNTTNNKWMWTWTTKGTDELGKWGENLKNWWELLYKEDPNNFDLEKKLEPFKTGTWTLKE